MIWGDYIVFVLLIWLAVPFVCFCFLRLAREKLTSHGLRFCIAVYVLALIPGLQILLAAAGMLFSVILGVSLFFRWVLMKINLDSITARLNTKWFDKTYRGW